MTGDQLKLGRERAGLTQAEAAAKLRLSQPYLSQLERGRRPVTPGLARASVKLFRLAATTLPIPAVPADPQPLIRSTYGFLRALASLGYPGLSRVRAGRPFNPAHMALDALSQDNLAARVTAALPWVFLKYSDLDWDWLLAHAKLRNLQNRLGFLVALTREVASREPRWLQASPRLVEVERELERARLASATTLCREGMPATERRWLLAHRSPLGRHWNVLTSLTSDSLRYGFAHSSRSTTIGSTREAR
jgi:transcriptional regulator with XRE-family HTH domain